MTTLAATDWVKNHWAVFPCLPDKKPATEHGFHDASRDLDQVERWFSPHPDWLVAVPTAGYLVVDLDYRPDRNVNAWIPWRVLAEPAGWDVCDAPMVETPSGGLHIWYRQPAGSELRNTAGQLGPGIDTRADGGYVVVPPSRTPAGEYAFINGVKDVPEVPGWLMAALAPKPVVILPLPSAPVDATSAAHRYGLRSLEGELGRLAQAPEGQRNDQLNRSSFAIGELVGAGVLDELHAGEQLYAVAMRVGLGDKEATATIVSGMNSGKRHPRAIRT